ncbi:MAG: hypothetical protein PV344_04330, partial [Anaplasma sp.]|nr:hypothetical protein [Anaplasma sp.]
MLTYCPEVFETYISRILGDSRNWRKLGPRENLVVYTTRRRATSTCRRRSFYCILNLSQTIRIHRLSSYFAL